MADKKGSPAPEDAAAAEEPDAALSGGLITSFYRLAAPFFASEEKWAAISLTAGVVALTVLQLGIQVWLNLWNRDFFNALEQRDWNAFIGVMGMFVVLAGSSMGVAVYQVYVKQLLQLRWRRWLTTRLVNAWLENGRHYQLNFIDTGVDNPDQRIAENVRGATDMAVEFALGILTSVLTLVAFSSILWVLSGPLALEIGGFAFDIPGYMVWAAIVYAAVGSLATYIIGRPIVAANIAQTTTEADYRFALVRLRENSEGVALIRGEADEQKGLSGFFSKVYSTATDLMRTQRRLMWLTSAYSMVGMVYPTLVASPRYFSGAITLGGLMQITLAFGQVQTGLTWFVDNFPRIAEWRAHVARLLEFEHAIATTTEATTAEGDAATITLVEVGPETTEETLCFRDLQIVHMDGNVVIGEANTTITQGEKVLILGESGSGKSTLFRAIAGLWPWGTGSITHPARRRMMFMPQRSYLPLGTLRSVVTYPQEGDRFAESDITGALKRCGVEHLIERLDETERWDQLLSVGEQQCLAFARLLLHHPGWVFMDEATSAMDEKTQADVMSLFREELASSTLISIGHRPGLELFHDRTMTLVKSESGAKLVIKRRRPSATKPGAAKAAQKKPRRRLAGKLISALRRRATR